MDASNEFPVPVARLGAWFAERIGRAVAVEALAPVSGGLVNDIFVVTLSTGDRYVLRCEPPSGPYAPYDMAAQFERERRIGASSLPIPRALWLERDPAVIGSVFWVSEFVVGETSGRLLDPSRPARTTAFVDALARIHAVDWRTLDLDGCLPVDTGEALGREIADAAAALDRVPDGDRPVFGSALDRLAAEAPRDPPLALVHGDCSLSNYLFRGDAVVAILDWDLARISDPIRDLGYYCAINDRFAMNRPLAERACARAAIVEAYRARTGASLATLPFWELHQTVFNALSWLRPGWGGQATGYAAYRDRLAEIMGDAG